MSGPDRHDPYRPRRDRDNIPLSNGNPFVDCLSDLNVYAYEYLSMVFFHFCLISYLQKGDMY